MKTITKLLTIALVGVLVFIGTTSTKADTLSVTNTASTMVGQGALKFVGQIKGITTAATSSNSVSAAFVWGTADGTTGSWGHTNNYSSLAGLTNGQSFNITIGGLAQATTYYWRGYAWQDDGGTNITALSGVTQSTNTLGGTASGPVSLGLITIGSTTYTGTVVIATNAALNVTNTYNTLKLTPQ